MKFFLTTSLLFACLSVFGQRTVNLSSDLVVSETILIDGENVTYNGNGNAIRCNGCNPAIRVINGGTVTFNGVYFPKVYASWIRVQDGSQANWGSKSMKGYIRTN